MSAPRPVRRPPLGTLPAVRRLTPEAELALALLESARTALRPHRCRRQNAAQGRWLRKEAAADRAEALAWMAGGEALIPFAHVCGLLGLDPDATRMALAGPRIDAAARVAPPPRVRHRVHHNAL